MSDINWQKNSGQMPCNPRQRVIVYFKNTGWDAKGKAILFDWDDQNLTHYAIIEPPKNK